MYCKFCGKEIIDGHVYCDICGKPVQIVADYNLLEDDLLPSFLGENKKNESASKTTGTQITQINANSLD